MFYHRHPAALGPCSYSWPDFSILTAALGEPEELPYDSIFLTRSRPSLTWPKTTCLPSSHEVLTVQMKNCEPLVPGLGDVLVCFTRRGLSVTYPALAMERTPGPVCLRAKFSSSNFSP
jgi:hypothetical protein